MAAMLADLIVYLHLLYVLFAVGGALLIILGWILSARRGAAGRSFGSLAFTRNRGFRLAHLAAVSLVAVEALAGVLCPLTDWEYALRRLAGQRVEAEVPFMARLARRIIFYDLPAWVFTVTYVAFAALVVAAFLLYPPRRRPSPSARPGLPRFVQPGAPGTGPSGKHDGSTVEGNLKTARPVDIRLATTLADGTRVLIRPLRARDRAELRRGFGLLSLASRRLRFISPMRRLTEPQLEQLTAVDQINHVALGVRDIGRRGQPGIAVARFVRLQPAAGTRGGAAGEAEPAGTPGPVVAEFAVTVIDEYQGRGLGTILLRLLLQAAETVGVEVLRGYVLEDNTGMWRMLQRFVIETRRDSGSVQRVDLVVGRNLRAGPLVEPSAPAESDRPGRPS